MKALEEAFAAFCVYNYLGPAKLSGARWAQRAHAAGCRTPAYLADWLLCDQEALDFMDAMDTEEEVLAWSKRLERAFAELAHS